MEERRKIVEGNLEDCKLERRVGDAVGLIKYSFSQQDNDGFRS
jgi:hypothetical protein